MPIRRKYAYYLSYHSEHIRCSLFLSSTAMPYTQDSYALSSEIWNYCVKLHVQVGLIHDFSIQYMPSVWLNSYVSNNLKVQENAFFWPKFQKNFRGWHPRTPRKIFASRRKKRGLRPQVTASAYTSKQPSYAPVINLQQNHVYLNCAHIIRHNNE